MVQNRSNNQARHFIQNTSSTNICTYIIIKIYDNNNSSLPTKIHITKTEDLNIKGVKELRDKIIEFDTLSNNIEDILKKNIPTNLIKKDKMGFGIPMNRWCRNELKDLFIETLGYEKVKNGGLVFTRCPGMTRMDSFLHYCELINLKPD